MIKKFNEFINEDAMTTAAVGSGTAVTPSSNGSFVSSFGTSVSGGDSGSAFSTNSNVAGMGPIFSAQPSSTPGDVAGSTVGSGDIGSVLKPFTKAGVTMNKFKKKRKKKSNRKEAIKDYDNLYVHKNESKVLDWKTFNESAISPLNYDKYLDILNETEIHTLSELNAIFKDVKIEFMDYNDYVKLDHTEEEKKSIPPKQMQMMGVNFGSYVPKFGKIIVVVDSHEFMKSLNHKYDKMILLKFLHDVLRHESIHLQQVSRMKVEDKPFAPKNKTEYLSNKNEIMAYAQSFIDELQARGFDKKRILQAIRNNNLPKPSIYYDYKNETDEKVFNRFKKYVYQYLEQI